MYESLGPCKCVNVPLGALSDAQPYPQTVWPQATDLMEKIRLTTKDDDKNSIIYRVLICLNHPRWLFGISEPSTVVCE